MKKRSYTDEDLIKAFNESDSIRQILKKLGKSPQGGGSYNQIKNDMKRLELDQGKLKGQRHLKGKTHNWNGQDLEKIMVENSTYTSGNHLKKRLLKRGILKNECSECGQDGEWNKKPLVMIIDHINGVNNDHRLENLRILCPNCNSQQSTFAGRNKK
jgi:hypothetical protein